MSPDIQNVGLELNYQSYPFGDDHKWYAIAAPGRQPMISLKKLNVGEEYEIFEGHPSQGIQIGEITEGKISLRGVKYYSEKLYVKKEVHGFKALFSGGKVAISPFDNTHHYSWEHGGIMSSNYSFILKDVETKEILIKTKDGHEKEADRITIHQRISSDPRVLEFWLMSYIHHRMHEAHDLAVQEERRREEAKERAHERMEERMHH